MFFFWEGDFEIFPPLKKFKIIKPKEKKLCKNKKIVSILHFEKIRQKLIFVFLVIFNFVKINKWKMITKG